LAHDAGSGRQGAAKWANICDWPTNGNVMLINGYPATADN